MPRMFAAAALTTLAGLQLLGSRGAYATTQCTKGPCRPGNELCAGAAGQPGKPQQYVFHLSDETCAINDPNGPFYDEVHGMYHNFYQDHLAEPQPDMGPGRGPDWGHWVSKDFLHWARLPVAIWNDKWYDAVAIFSGSTTIVDGKPVIVYPGLCNKKVCPTSFTYDAVIPADMSDPFLTNWSKPSYNPLVNGTGDDPSTAWQTPSGEWRMIGNQHCIGEPGHGGAPIYGSMDFKTWYKVGCTTLPLGDCPTFFPRPALTPGSGEGLTAAQLDALPNWVHKAGSSNDLVQVGQWTDGKPGAQGKGGTPGTWLQGKGQGKGTPLDQGKTHASKDFWDPVKKRRIMWVWGTLPNGIQTIPREMTFDPRTGKINYAPVEEMEELRTEAPLASLPSTKLSPGTPAVLKASSASDVEVVFEKPATAANLTLDFAGGSLFFQYSPGSATAAVGFAAKQGSATEGAILAAEAAHAASVASKAAVLASAQGQQPRRAAAANLTTFMEHTDLGGNDMTCHKHYPAHTKPEECEALCQATKGCGAWVYVIRGTPAGSGDCCLKHDVVQTCPRVSATCTAGVLKPTTKCDAKPHGGGGGGGKPRVMADVVSMLSSDTHISIRLFLDTAVAEAYFMGGRVAMTIPVAVSTTDWSVSVGASTSATLANATSWGMSSIYVTKEQVLAAPRRG